MAIIYIKSNLNVFLDLAYDLCETLQNLFICTVAFLKAFSLQKKMKKKEMKSGKTYCL